MKITIYIFFILILTFTTMTEYPSIVVLSKIEKKSSKFILVLTPVIKISESVTLSDKALVTRFEIPNSEGFTFGIGYKVNDNTVYRYRVSKIDFASKKINNKSLKLKLDKQCLPNENFKAAIAEKNDIENQKFYFIYKISCDNPNREDNTDESFDNFEEQYEDQALNEPFEEFNFIDAFKYLSLNSEATLNESKSEMAEDDLILRKRLLLI